MPKLVLKARQKRRELSEIMRRMIVSGQLQSGSKFPTYQQMERMFDTSRGTLQYAVAELQRDGYLIGRKRRDLIVAEHLPCYSRFALLIENSEHGNQFWKKMVDGCSRLEESGVSIEIYRNMSAPMESGRRKLQDAIDALRIGGCFFIFDPVGEWQNNLLNNERIPKVVFSKEPNDNPSVITATFEINAQLSLVGQCMREKGVRRAACITMGNQEASNLFETVMQRYGIATDSYLNQSIPETKRSAAANLVELLLQLPPEIRPDGIYVNDENLLEYVIHGIIAGNPVRWKHLRLVSHANFPTSQVYPIPVDRIGYDTMEILKQVALRLGEWHRNGNTERILITPKWEKSQ